MENNKQTEASKAYHKIVDAIIEGELLPGERISRKRLADISGTSVIPVTEALKRLESNGLVVTHARSNSVVALPSQEEMEGKYMLRAIIECKIAEILCENRITKKQESALREIAKKLDQAEEVEGRAYLHRDFHYMLASFTGYACFTDIFDNACLYFMICQAISSRRQSPTPEDLHSRIIDAIVSGDCEHARKTMHEHVYDSYDYVMRDLAKFRQKAK